MTPTLLHVTASYASERDKLKTFCLDNGYAYEYAFNELEALDILLDKLVDAIVIDTQITLQSAKVFIEHIQNDIEHQHTPIIIVSAQYKSSDFIQTLDSQSIIAYFNYKGYFTQLTNLISHLFSKNREIEQLRQELDSSEVKNVIDALTGVHNRYGAEDTYNHLLARHEAYHESFSIIMMDIDHFKRVNDTYGHDIGDEVLVSFSKTIQEVARRSDTLVRLGGEEFALLLGSCDLIEADETAHRIRDRLNSTRHSSKNLHITASFGVVEYREGEDIKASLKRVDELLYMAKNEGRDRVISG